MLEVGGQGALGADVALVAQGAALSLQVAGAVDAAVMLEPGIQAATVDDLLAFDMQVASRRQAFVELKRACGHDLGIPPGINAVVQRDVLGLELDVALGGLGTGQGQLAAGIELQITRAGDHVPGELDPNPGLGAHQLDSAGVHPAQGRGVDGQLRYRAGVCRLGGGDQGGGIDLVATADDRQMLRMELRVDPGAAGDEFELVDVVCVKAAAVDVDRAAVHVVTGQAAVFQDRRTGTEGDLGRIDKAAAVTADAVGVGDNDMRALPRDFGIALELARAAAVDLIENDVGRATVEVAIADDIAAQLGALQVAGGVVEDDALLADVVIAEFVVGQAAAIGRGDVDDGDAVGCLADAGDAAVDHDAIRLGQQRLPEHRVGQDQGQPTFGQAPERFTRLQGSRRLTGQEGELTNVHVVYLG